MLGSDFDKLNKEIVNFVDVDQQFDVTILHLNVRSSRKNYAELESHVFGLDSQPDILCLSETWLSNDDNIISYSINGYRNLAIKNRNTVKV